MQDHANDLIRSFRAKATGKMVTYRAVVWRKSFSVYPKRYMASYGENTLEAAISAGTRNRDLDMYEVEVFLETYIPNIDGSAFILESATSLWSSAR